MNAQQIFEKWQNGFAAKSVIPQEAIRYIQGDDSAEADIPRRSLYIWADLTWLLDETQGEYGETARRCLRATALMNRYGITMNGNFELAKKAGFTLKEVIEDGMPDMYSASAQNCPQYAKIITAVYGDEAERLVTPAYLRLMFEKNKKAIRKEYSYSSDSARDSVPALRAALMSYFIAARLFIDGKGDKKAYGDEFLRFAEAENGTAATVLLAELVDYDDRFAGALRQLLTVPVNIQTVFMMNGVWSKKENYALSLCQRLGNEKYYIYTALMGYMHEEEQTKAAKTAAENCAELMPWLFGMAVLQSGGKKTAPDDKAALAKSAKGIAARIAAMLGRSVSEDERMSRFDGESAEYVCRLAFPLALALKNGAEGAEEMLGEYEKYFTQMLISMSGDICIDKEDADKISPSEKELSVRTAHLIYSEPEQTAKIIRFSDKARFAANTGIVMLTPFAMLYDYSEKARNVIYALIKSAEYHGNINNYSKASEIMNIFLMGQNRLDISFAEAAKKLMDGGISMNMYFTCAVLAETDTYWVYHRKEGFAALPEIVKGNMDEAIKFYDTVKGDAKQAAFWAELLYKKAGCSDVGLIIEMLGSKSKNVRKVAAEAASSREEEMREMLENMLPKLKGDSLAQAQGIIKKWDNNRKYGKDFTFASNALAEEYVSENNNPAALKKAAFIPEDLFGDVRFSDMDGKASPELVRFIIGEYLILDEPYRISVCDKLAARLYMPDFQTCLENIYQHWLEKGADNKTKMILVPYCAYASDTQILALKRQISAWADAQRGALGAFTVNAMAVNGGGAALMTVNDIAAKFGNNQVKKAARAAFSYAAKVLGVAEDVLADKIVPTLGLDKNGERILDFGGRTFTLSLMPDFSLSITDNAKGKAVKSLPKPATGDDPIKAEEAKKYVSELKKQLKAVTASQKLRLEAVFRNGRTWTSGAWNELFVDNPVMRRFAETLIWGVYADGSLAGTFRYCGDGSFCDENDDTFTLPENAEISLVHPVEMTAESISAWQEQLSDYEISQPFAQISARVVTLGEGGTEKDNYIKKYAGRTFTAGAMNGAAKKYSLVRSTVGDGGCFTGYFIQDRVLGLGMKFGFDGMYMGQDFGEEVELTDMYIYKLPENDEQPDCYSDYDALPPSEAPARFISCCLDLLEGILD